MPPLLHETCKCEIRPAEQSSRELNLKRATLYPWIVALLCCCVSCVYIPHRELLMSRTGYMSSLYEGSNGCVGYALADAKDGFLQTELDSSSIDVLNWNILKGDRRFWEKDFERISQNMDLLLIQEACLRLNVLDALKIDQMGWIFSASFFYAATNIPTGVLTASYARPVYCRALRAIEPIIRTPKSSLVTKYRLSDTNEMLLVVNVHAINFCLGTVSFRSQALELKKEMESHPGPIILAGDFNTWSANRLSSLEEITRDLNLKAVRFKVDHRRKVFRKPVDHIFYRGLEVTHSKVIKVKSSDHNPLIVTFRVAEKIQWVSTGLAEYRLI